MRACAVLLVLGLGASPTPALAQVESLELAVKATYLCKFAPFVEPLVGQAAASEPLQLCVVGADPFGGLLDRAARAQSDSRAIMVRRLPVADRFSGCDVMFVGGSPRQSVAEALEAVRGMPVLTVTDLPSSSPSTGIVNFVVHDNRVRFEIDAGRARENGLAISAKLMQLATSVRP